MRPKGRSRASFPGPRRPGCELFPVGGTGPLTPGPVEAIAGLHIWRQPLLGPPTGSLDTGSCRGTAPSPTSQEKEVEIPPNSGLSQGAAQATVSLRSPQCAQHRAGRQSWRELKPTLCNKMTGCAASLQPGDRAQRWDHGPNRVSQSPDPQCDCIWSKEITKVR